MAYNIILFLIISVSTHVLAITCPGFPGYCSESFVGQTCVVVCSKGRPNVPLCQDDGTWTDIPRCIEHDPGVEEQIPGMCPGITGYCSESFLHQRCNFRCDTGKLIDSKCTQDGTWVPYPVCPGDLRETNDGCNPCPGPVGPARNRNSEIDARVKAQQQALETRFLGINSKRRQPSNAVDTGNRVVRPTFAGSLAFGRLPSSSSNKKINTSQKTKVTSFIPTQTKRPFTPPPPTRRPTPPAPTPPVTTRRPISFFEQPTSRPASRQEQVSLLRQPQVPQQQSSSSTFSVGSSGRFGDRPEPVAGPAPSFQQPTSRRNQFSGGFSQQRNQNMFGQQSRNRRPQTGFTNEQKQIIQEALAKLPKSVGGGGRGSNFFRQQGTTQMQQTQQSQFSNFPQQRPQMNTMTTNRRLNFNPLRSERPQMQQLQPQSRPQVRPQPPPQQRPSPTPVQPRPVATQVNRQSRPQTPSPQQPRRSRPTGKQSALDLILGLQANRGPTDAKFGGTTPPPPTRGPPKPVVLFQEDNSRQSTPQASSNGNSFGVFQEIDLAAPSQSSASPLFQAFPAIPDTERSSRVQASDNSQFGLFQTVQL